MSEHVRQLSEILHWLSNHSPVSGRAGLKALDALLAEQRLAGLEDASEFFKRKQKELDRQRTAAKSLSNAEIGDLKTEAGRCGWAAQQLRMEQGRRKKGKEKTG